MQQKKKKIKRTASIEELKADHSIDNEEKLSDKSASSEDIALLKKQIKELQMKVDVMTEVFEILKKGQGTDTDIEVLSNKEKFLIISALKKKYSILSLLKHLSMSRSSYYYVEQTNKKEDKYKTARTLLKEIFSKNYECYGYSSMTKKWGSPDNSACEGFFGRMKTECFYNHSLEDLSLEELKIYMNRYIQWYNNDRIKIH